MNVQELKYPIGELKLPEKVSPTKRSVMIETISTFPEKIRQRVEKLTMDQRNWNYRPGGWNIKQVVHHCADSHINALCRFKLTLTETEPNVRPYIEAKWAQLPDGLTDDLTDSLAILKGVHARWTLLLRSMSPDDFQRRFYHPENQIYYTLDQSLANYSWHCDHHYAHIEQAIQHRGEF